MLIAQYKKPLIAGGLLAAGTAALAVIPQSNNIIPLLICTATALAVAKVAKVDDRINATGLIPAAKKTNENQVIEVLESLGLKGCELVKTHHGKILMRHIIKVPRGKLPALNNTDIARNLGVQSVTINPNAGNGCIAIELPAPKRTIISFEAIIKSKAWIDAAKGKALPVLLGEDVDGSLLVIDLATQPHMLIAGTTGSGKSVALNTALLSLLSVNPLLDLILIDPKQVELAVYNKSRFCREPVITDMEIAAQKLAEVVDVMERRYSLMAAAGVKNIAGYNKTADEKLQHIVVVVDEFADMMMMVGKEVEELIARIGQKARAAGIHLVLATQRPSVDVITGLIKSNIPTRLALKVAGRINSEIIIGQGGAENLLGNGDGLAQIKDSATPLRFHGAYCPDDDVKRWVI